MSLYIPIHPGLVIATDRRNWMTLEGPSESPRQYAPTLPLLIKVSDKLRAANLTMLEPHLFRMSQTETNLKRLRETVPKHFKLALGERIYLDQDQEGFRIMAQYYEVNKFTGPFAEHRLVSGPGTNQEIWSHNKTVVDSLTSYCLFTLRECEDLRTGINAYQRGLGRFMDYFWAKDLFLEFKGKKWTEKAA